MPYHFVWVAVIIATVVGTAQRPLIANRAGQAAQPLRLSVRVARQSYRMSEIIIMETQITNVSNGALFVDEWDLCWNVARGLVLRVVDAKGSEVRTDFLPDCVPPPPRAGDVYRFIKIDRQRFYGLVDQLPVRKIVNKPGEYDLDVSFESSISADWVSKFLPNDPISKLPLWTAERPPIRATKTHIKVIP